MENCRYLLREFSIGSALRTLRDTAIAVDRTSPTSPTASHGHCDGRRGDCSGSMTRAWRGPTAKVKATVRKRVRLVSIYLIPVLPKHPCKKRQDDRCGQIRCVRIAQTATAHEITIIGANVVHFNILGR
jgi:hypothetical protein